MSDGNKMVSGVPSSFTIGIPGAENVVDASFGAQRVRLMPTEFNNTGFNGGHYRVAAATGALTGVAAGGSIFSFRWAAPNIFALIKSIRVGQVITTAFTAAQAVDMDAIIARGFTAADTGGTAITPILGNSQKVRSGFMATSQVNDMRIATTAALGAGTKTLDAQAIGITPLPNTNALATGQAMVDLYKEDAAGQHPIILANNEGFNIRMVTAMGAVGVIKAYAAIEWVEIPGF